MYRDLIATLINIEKIRAKNSDQFQNIHSQNFIWEFSGESENDRAVIGIQTEINQNILNHVIKIMKEAFDLTNPLKEADVRDYSLNFFRTKAEDLKKIQYGKNGEYPGKAILEKIQSTRSTIIRFNDSETVFNKI